MQAELLNKLTIIRYIKNSGKGAALLKGVAQAQEAGFTHVLTMDADYQHPAHFIQQYMNLSAQHPEAMILGEPIFDRLDAELAYALMSINAVKGVEIGDGFKCIEAKGTQFRDEITPAGFLSNHAGGILGGISSGQTITASIALKPTSSLRLPGKSIDTEGNVVDVITEGRHDPCVGIRATPIAEAMVAIVLMDHFLRQRAQNGGAKG